jgi:uncharacterized protein (DUF1499 family)
MAAPRNLGVNNGKLTPMPKSPNAVSSQTANDAMKVDALPFVGDIQATHQKILRCLQSMGGNTVQQDDSDYIYTVFVTPLMRFKDDVEFYLDEVSQQVHFRSASRVGYSDMGANRKRYEAFTAAYLA